MLPCWVEFLTIGFDFDLPCERLNDLHPQPLAGGGVEAFRQGRAVIGNRKRVAIDRIGLQADGDPALAMFRRVGDQFTDDEAEWNRGRRRQVDFNAFDEDLLRAFVRRQHRGKVAREILEEFPEFDGLHAVVGMKAMMDTRNHGNAIGRDGQLCGRFRVWR